MKIFKTRLGVVVMAVLALVAASCGGDGGDAASDTDTTTTAAPTTTAATMADDDMGDDVSADTADDDMSNDMSEDMDHSDHDMDDMSDMDEDYEIGDWEQVAGGPDCMCADGSDYHYFVREANPKKVVFYLQGGGACFSIESCDFETGNYTPSIDPTDTPANYGGIFDFDNPRNPFSEHSFVMVPYCTGDIHLGDTETTYPPTLTVQHNGFVNASTAMAEMVSRFDSAAEIVVAGSSAGSAAAPLYSGLIADEYPDAMISVVADSSGAYPSVPLVNQTIGNLWGTTNVIPDWPVNAGTTAADWGTLELFTRSGTHAPQIRFSRFDFAFDATQVFFATLAGFNATTINQLILQNEQTVESAGVDLESFLAPSEEHTILWKDELYTYEVDGISYLDWMTAFVSGEDVDDVVCSTCT